MSQGIERECLRVDQDGKTSKLFHPKELGHKLKNSYITTDYSENLLEFITAPHDCVEDLYDELLKIHQFVLLKNPNELIWPCSMPAILPDKDSDIPVADYGTSNVGLLKKAYRVGLGNRYGKKMQSIAGIHFNFSLSDKFWDIYRKNFELDSLQEAKNIGYFSMIRNYKRYQWILSYLFGASPCVDKSFLIGRDHKLDKLNESTYFLKDSTSLRMGGLGYTSNLQDEISICYNEIDTYIKTLESARLKSIPAYEKIGLKSQGDYLQLNTNLLQIDNEFYSTVRPKRTARSRESALQALHSNGVEYIEVRILDVNPYDELGFSVDQMKFVQMFLTTCLFMDSPKFDANTYQDAVNDLREVVTNGQKLNVDLKNKALNFFDELKSNLSLFEDDYATIYESELKKVHDPSLLPSAKVLKESMDGYSNYMLKLAKLNKEKTLALKSKSRVDLDKVVAESFKDEDLEREMDKRNFDEFLAFYFESIRIKGLI